MSKIKGEYDKNGKYRVAKGDKSGLGGEYTVDETLLAKNAEANTKTVESISSEVSNKATVGVKTSGTERKQIPLPKEHHYKDFLTAAEKDGFTFYEGPWGSSDKERTVIAEKYDENLGGKFTLHVADRQYKNLSGSIAYQQYGEYTPMQYIEGWFVADNDNKITAHAEHALKISNDGMYSYEDLIDTAGTCDKCGRNVGARNLKPVAFANAACSECYEGMKAERETPGWYN